MRSSLAVAVGAALGAGGRWAVAEALSGGRFPWPTLLVNLAGCAAIGAASVRLRRGTDLWYFCVTGLLGGFTTASTFGVETRDLLADGRAVTAAGYVAASVLGGIAAVSWTRAATLRATGDQAVTA
jgi:CrcB protein